MGTTAAFRRIQLGQLALNRLRRISLLDSEKISEQRLLIVYTVYSVYLDCQRLGIKEEALPIIQKIRDRFQ